jgi:2-polyprenyl-6-methoxyphenol hydroxylase-like FAD-dependent oxidoreductase
MDWSKSMTESTEQLVEATRTTCCIVGGGPAGLILALLLARRKIEVTLLEAHHDFDRDFRGDTIHPSTLELMQQLGLSERLHQLPHRKLSKLQVISGGERTTLVDLSRVRQPFPYVMIMPQAAFLQLLADEARKYPSFRLVLGANVQHLIEDTGTVRGVQYQQHDGSWHEVRATLTVGADGRFSRMRKLAGFTPVRSSPPMDIVWFRLPRRAEDEARGLTGALNIGGGRFAVLFDRPDEQWQLGYAILKGSFAHLKEQGITALQKGVAELIPDLADRVGLLTDFQHVVVLSVESNLLPSWHKPGLLLLGDAAHVMSPVAGIGIQYAIQDAVATANLLTRPLQSGDLTDAHLAAVQRQREGAVKKAQRLQRFLQNNIVAQALRPDRPFRLPCLLRLVRALPFVRDLPARFISQGFGTVRLKDDPTVASAG